MSWEDKFWKGHSSMKNSMESQAEIGSGILKERLVSGRFRPVELGKVVLNKTKFVRRHNKTHMSNEHKSTV